MYLKNITRTSRINVSPLEFKNAQTHRYATLVPGGIFKKYNKRCRAQLRNIRIDKDLKQILWSDPNSMEKIKGSLDAKDIVGIQIGCM